MAEKVTKDGKRVSFHFHPYDWEKKGHVVEKSEDGITKRRYLCGITSGLKIDGHGEQMTEKCIKSFMDQANSGDILLYPDVHGIKASQDIGRLTVAKVLDDGDWYTEYRLYDDSDEIGPVKKEIVDTLWKQLNGFPPYTKPKQKGFSIEGIIPDSAVGYNTMNKGIIDDVSLDGVVLVPRPAYLDSMATAITKALGGTTVYRANSIQETLREKVQQQEINEQYYKLKWDYQDALEQIVESIMKKNNNNKQEELEIALDEYKRLMIELVMNSSEIFAGEQEGEEFTGEPVIETLSKSENPKVILYKNLLTELKNLSKIMEEKSR